MLRDISIVTFVAICTAIVILVLATLFNDANECWALGGQYVRGLILFECVGAK